MAPPRAPLHAAPALLAVIFLTAGCSVDVNRARVNKPLDQEFFKRLEVGKTGMGEILDSLGAPDKVEAKSGKNYIWYLHKDTSSVGVRFQSPVSFLGYRHTVVELDADAVDTSSMRLVFDAKNDILEDKSLRLAPAFAKSENVQPGLSISFIPRYGFSALTFGDGGEKSYGTLFQPGQLFGGFLGISTTPYFMLLAGGNFQHHEGQSFYKGTDRIGLEDLHLYQFEVGGRFEVPPEFFVSFWDMNKLREMFYSEDIARRRGILLYFQWTVGGTYNEDVDAQINGVQSGTYFKETLSLSTNIGIGAQYLVGRLGFQAGIDYILVGAFNGGSAPLDTDAGDLQDLFLTFGLSYRLGR